VLVGPNPTRPEHVVRPGKGGAPRVVADLEWSFMMDRALPSPPSMLARVRWSESRACLEAVEAPRPTGMNLARPPTRAILRFLSAGLYRLTGEGALAAIGLGEEWREPVRCTLGPSRAVQAP